MPREAGKIVGSWQIINAQSVNKAVAGESAADEAEPNEAKMSIEFSSNGKLTTQTQMGSIDSQKVGRWNFQSFNTATKTMNIECILGGQTTEHKIEFVDSDTIQWIPPNMAGTNKRLQFVRSR